MTSSLCHAALRKGRRVTNICSHLLNPTIESSITILTQLRGRETRLELERDQHTNKKYASQPISFSRFATGIVLPHRLLETFQDYTAPLLARARQRNDLRLPNSKRFLSNRNDCGMSAYLPSPPPCYSLLVPLHQHPPYMGPCLYSVERGVVTRDSPVSRPFSSLPLSDLAGTYPSSFTEPEWQSPSAPLEKSLKDGVLGMVLWMGNM